MPSAYGMSHATVERGTGRHVETGIPLLARGRTRRIAVLADDQVLSAPYM
jgi:hypothetical protein